MPNHKIFKQQFELFKALSNSEQAWGSKCALKHPHKAVATVTMTKSPFQTEPTFNHLNQFVSALIVTSSGRAVMK